VNKVYVIAKATRVGLVYEWSIPEYSIDYQSGNIAVRFKGIVHYSKPVFKITAQCLPFPGNNQATKGMIAG
jgi:hypothetical protein